MDVAHANHREPLNSVMAGWGLRAWFEGTQYSHFAEGKQLQPGVSTLRAYIHHLDFHDRRVIGYKRKENKAELFKSSCHSVAPSIQQAQQNRFVMFPMRTIHGPVLPIKSSWITLHASKLMHTDMDQDGHVASTLRQKELGGGGKESSRFPHRVRVRWNSRKTTGRVNQEAYRAQQDAMPAVLHLNGGSDFQNLRSIWVEDAKPIPICGSPPSNFILFGTTTHNTTPPPPPPTCIPSIIMTDIAWVELEHSGHVNMRTGKDSRYQRLQYSDPQPGWENLNQQAAIRGYRLCDAFRGDSEDFYFAYETCALPAKPWTVPSDGRQPPLPKPNLQFGSEIPCECYTTYQVAVYLGVGGHHYCLLPKPGQRAWRFRASAFRPEKGGVPCLVSQWQLISKGRGRGHVHRFISACTGGGWGAMGEGEEGADRRKEGGKLA